jgi:hypothetical protein
MEDDALVKIRFTLMKWWKRYTRKKMEAEIKAE